MGKQKMCAEDNRTTKVTRSEKFTASGTDHLQRFLQGAGAGEFVSICNREFAVNSPKLWSLNSLYPSLRQDNCAQPTNVAYLQFDYSDSIDPRSAHCTHTRSARSDET